MQQGDDIADKLLPALNVAQSVQLVVAYIHAAFHVRRFQYRLVGSLAELLDQHRRRLARVGEHYRGRTLQYFHQISIRFLHPLQRFGKKRVLYDHQLDVAFEALATQRRSLLSIQSLDVRNVKVRILVELLGEAVNDNQFFFLRHLLNPPSYLVSTDLASICKPGLIVVERKILLT